MGGLTVLGGEAFIATERDVARAKERIPGLKRHCMQRPYDHAASRALYMLKAMVVVGPNKTYYPNSFSFMMKVQYEPGDIGDMRTHPLLAPLPKRH